jgi:hypothetical protein
MAREAEKAEILPDPKPKEAIYPMLGNRTLRPA